MPAMSTQRRLRPDGSFLLHGRRFRPLSPLPPTDELLRVRYDTDDLSVAIVVDAQGKERLAEPAEEFPRDCPCIVIRWPAAEDIAAGATVALTTLIAVQACEGGDCELGVATRDALRGQRVGVRPSGLACDTSPALVLEYPAACDVRAGDRLTVGNLPAVKLCGPSDTPIGAVPRATRRKETAEVEVPLNAESMPFPEAPGTTVHALPDGLPNGDSVSVVYHREGVSECSVLSFTSPQPLPPGALLILPHNPPFEGWAVLAFPLYCRPFTEPGPVSPSVSVGVEW